LQKANTDILQVPGQEIKHLQKFLTFNPSFPLSGFHYSIYEHGDKSNWKKSFEMHEKSYFQRLVQFTN